MAAAQRDRMLRGMIDAVGERGYARVSVAHVLERAGVSRETFYEQFLDKQSCFLAAYGRSVETLTGELLEATDSSQGMDGGPIERLGQLLDRYLGALSREPAVARTFLIEGYAAGAPAIALRIESQRAAADFIASLVGAANASQRFACEAFVVAMVGLAEQKVGTGQAATLMDLRAPLLELARSSLGAGPPMARGRDVLGHDI